MGALKDIYKKLFCQQYDEHVAPPEPEVEPVSDNDKCECFSSEDVRSQVAVELDIMDVFSDIVDEDDIIVLASSVESRSEYSGPYFNRSRRKIHTNCIQWTLSNGEKATLNVEFSANGIFLKSACLTCNSCLGWMYYSGSSDGSMKVECPDEYIRKLIVSEVNIANDKVKDREEYSRKMELAKKICDVK